MFKKLKLNPTADGEEKKNKPIPVRSALHKWSFDKNDKKSSYIDKRKNAFAFMKGPQVNAESKEKAEEKVDVTDN